MTAKIASQNILKHRGVLRRQIQPPYGGCIFLPIAEDGRLAEPIDSVPVGFAQKVASSSRSHLTSVRCSFAARNWKPFKRFPRILAQTSTWLKPGENEIRNYNSLLIYNADFFCKAVLVAVLRQKPLLRYTRIASFVFQSLPLAEQTGASYQQIVQPVSQVITFTCACLL